MTREKIRLECLRLAAVQGAGAVFTLATARSYEEYVTGIAAHKEPKTKATPVRSTPTYTGHSP